MSNVLLDYFFPITAIEPTPQASTAFLRQVALVVKPKDMVTPQVTLCTTPTAVAALTDNVDATQLFAGGMSRVYLVVSDDLDLATLLNANQGLFYTVLISSDFVKADMDDDGESLIDLGTFPGVLGLAEEDKAFLAVKAAEANTCAFYTAGNGAKNMCFAFGKLLSNQVAWRNQQYIAMPFADDVTVLGDAEQLFDDKISFVLSDDEFGDRLGLFAVGGKAIFAPYVVKNLEIDLQSEALSYISGNQPAYTVTNAALLEDELSKVIQRYIDQQLIEAGLIEISLVQNNFVANGNINIAEPRALWRIFGELRQAL